MPLPLMAGVAPIRPRQAGRPTRPSPGRSPSPSARPTSVGLTSASREMASMPGMPCSAWSCARRRLDDDEAAQDPQDAKPIARGGGLNRVDIAADDRADRLIVAAQHAGPAGRWTAVRRQSAASRSAVRRSAVAEDRQQAEQSARLRADRAGQREAEDDDLDDAEWGTRIGTRFSFRTVRHYGKSCAKNEQRRPTTRS